MTLKSKLTLSIIFFGIIVVTIVIALNYSLRQADDFFAKETMATKLLLEAHELSELSNEYILFRENRQAVQWETKYGSVAAILSQLTAVRPEEQILLDGFTVNLNHVREIFDNIRAAEETASVASPPDRFAKLIRISWSRLMVQTQEMILDASRLAHFAREERWSVLRRTAFIVSLMIVTLVVFIASNYLFIYWRMVRSIAILRKGTEIVGSGSLGYRIEEIGKDEIGDLARAFNKMTVDLGTVLASKEELTREIEERKRAESRLEKTLADLKRSNKELEQFAYVASHDLQEPLRMVSSYTQLLAERYKDQLDDKARKWINYAVDGAVRMQRLIQDLLSFSRVTTRGSEFKVVDIHAALGMALANLVESIRECRALVTNDDLPHIYGDQTQLSQVFQNLISNAIKFRSAEQPRIHVSVQDQNGRWVFSVKDNGIGIDEQYRDKVFVLFQRLHTREEYPGTGIGLALCQRIIQRHGGEIWFDSVMGEGSTFFFTMPKNRAEERGDGPQTTD